MHIVQMKDDDEMERLEECFTDSREYAICIATIFIEWIEKKQNDSTDQVFMMVINFVILVNFYCEFCVVLATCDAIMIECLYREFLPTYFASKKKHYFKIVMTMMERLYSKISHEHLQLIRINCTLPLHSGFDKQGIPMANFSLDGIIKLFQKYYHHMKFNSEYGWARHTPN